MVNQTFSTSFTSNLLETSIWLIIKMLARFLVGVIRAKATAAINPNAKNGLPKGQSRVVCGRYVLQFTIKNSDPLPSDSDPSPSLPLLDLGDQPSTSTATTPEGTSPPQAAASSSLERLGRQFEHCN